MSDSHCSCGPTHENEPDREHEHGESCSCSQEESVEPEGSREGPKDVPLPDPTILDLVKGLATQAMISMGAFPHPVTGEVNMLLFQAKHLIDTVEMLFEKTRGNLTGEESKTIDSVLHDLRMIYIAAQNEKNRRDQ